MQTNGKRDYIKLDWSINEFEDRINFLKEEGYLDSISLHRKSKVLSAQAQHAITYLFRSDDVESGRKDRDYPFYRDESEFLRSSSKIVMSLDDDRNDNFDRDEFLHKELCRSKGVSDIYFFDEEDTYSDMDKIFQENLSHKELRNILVSKKMFMDNKQYLSSKLIANLELIFKSIKDNCRDKIDYQIINELSNGLTELDISEKIKLSQQAVNKRIQRMFNSVLENNF